VHRVIVHVCADGAPLYVMDMSPDQIAATFTIGDDERADMDTIVWCTEKDDDKGKHKYRRKLSRRCVLIATAGAFITVACVLDVVAVY